MPKMVDPNVQKERIAEAAWRVIGKEGIENASVRKIAAEAGVSPGILQHYFKTQTQLIVFAMERVVQHVTQRISGFYTGHFADHDKLTMKDAHTLLLHLLPVNEAQLLEAEVWLALTMKSLHEPDLQPISRDTYRSMQEAIHALLEEVSKSGELKEGLHVREEAVRLQMLLDALTLHRLVNPGAMTAEEMNKVLKQHLDSLSAFKGE